MRLWRITFTGIDESCSPKDLHELWRREPRLELGVLYSDRRAGVGRYPPHDFMRWVARGLVHFVPALALHICGAARRRFLAKGTLLDLPGLYNFDRLQLNGTFTGEEGDQLQAILDLTVREGQALITQHDTSPELAARIRADHHHVLFDASGGNGTLRENWPAPLPGKVCGYAGGLGPDTLARELPRIVEAAGGMPFWIDMESSLRTADDKFSLEAAHRALDVIQAIAPLQLRRRRHRR